MAETFQKTVDRIKFFHAGESEDPDAVGPQNYETMMLARVARVHYQHAAQNTKKIGIFRAEEACEIRGAHVRPETGWISGAASEVLRLEYDDGAGGAPTTIATIDGLSQDMIGDQDNEWRDPTNGLPGVYAAGPFVTVPKGSWVVLQQLTNGAGAVMGATTLEITYRYK